MIIVLQARLRVTSTRWVSYHLLASSSETKNTMSGFYLAFALTVMGMLLYHLSQKAVPKEANPFFVIVIAYVVGIALCLVIAIVYPAKKGLLETFRGSTWAVFPLG